MQKRWIQAEKTVIDVSVSVIQMIVQMKWLFGVEWPYLQNSMRGTLHYFKLIEGHFFDGSNCHNDFWGERRISISSSLSTDSVICGWHHFLLDTLQAIWIEATEDFALSEQKYNNFKRQFNQISLGFIGIHFGHLVLV